MFARPRLFGESTIRFSATWLVAVLLFNSSGTAQPESTVLPSHLPEPMSAAQQLRDPALRTLPRADSTEIEDRRTRSLTHYGHGRLLERRDQLSAAIREYQTAWVWNPASKQILDELIPACFRGEQQSVAYRYGKICLERSWETVAPLRGIAFNTVLESSSDESWDIYDLAIRAAQRLQDDNALLGLHFDRLRVAFLDESFPVALPSASFLLAALPNPDKYTLDETTREDLWGDTQAIYALMGEVFFESEQLDLAEQAFRQAATAQDESESPTETAILHLQLARLREKQTRKAEARNELNKYFAATKEATSQTAYELLERLTDQQPAQFVSELEQQAEDQPRNRALAHFLADFYLRQKLPDKALPFCEQLAEAEEDATAQDQLLQSYAQLNQAGPLVATLGRVTKLYGDLDLVEDAVTQIASDEQLYPSVLSEATRRLNDTKRPIVWNECLGIAFLCFAKEDFARAKRFLRAGQTHGVDDPAMIGSLFTYGNKCIAADRYGDAISAFEACVAVEPEADEANDIRYFLAVAQQLAGDYTAALATIDQGLQQETKSFALAIRRPSILQATGRLVEARQAYETLIREFDPNLSDDELRADLFSARSVVSAICSELGDFRAAEEWLIEALGEFPTDAGAKNDLGYLWADEGKYLDLARQLTADAVAAEPDNIAFLDSHGWVLFRLGQAEQAIGPLERAVAGEQVEGVLFDHLGDVYREVGRLDEAIAAWGKAKIAFQEEEETDKIEAVQEKIDLANKRKRVAE